MTTEKTESCSLLLFIGQNNLNKEYSGIKIQQNFKWKKSGNCSLLLFFILSQDDYNVEMSKPITSKTHFSKTKT